MVKGLNSFVKHFGGLEESYILIDGTACDLWLRTFELPFRVTKDLDVVLVIETLDELFVKRFWEFIDKADYSSQHCNSEAPILYRFHGPQTDEFPETIELFCRQPFELPEGSRLAPFPVGEEQISLSVILMDADYYEFVIEHRTLVDDVPAIPAQCLIPLKAKAFLNLTSKRKADKKSVQMRHVKKHRNDVFLLLLTLTPDERVDLPDSIRRDMKAFLDEMPPDSSVWNDIRTSVNNPALPDTEELILFVEEIFQLGDR